MMTTDFSSISDLTISHFLLTFSLLILRTPIHSDKISSDIVVHSCTMPTLMTSTVPVNQQPPQMSPAELTLSFGGVEFALTPSDNAAEVSYRKNGQDILLSLTSFTGSLLVSMQAVRPTVTPVHRTATVEEEPYSPEVVQNKVHVSPGQQHFSFEAKTKKTKAGSKALPKKKTENKPKKRNVQVKAPKPSTKKIDTRVVLDHQRQPPLCQTMETSQPTQMMPDLSQTMDTSSGLSDADMLQVQSALSTSSEKETKTSVLEILDRVNSSNDSVATVRDDDDNSVNSKEVDKDCGSIVDEKMSDCTQGDASASAVVTSLQNKAKPDGYPSPCPRWGHTMTKLKGNRLLVYGGQSFDLEGNPIILSDVHVYDTTKRVWSKPIGGRAEARQWHSATFLPERQLLISFGGETIDNGKKNKVVTSDSLKVLDTEIMLWFPPAVSGDIPTGRSGHTATLLPNTNELVLFGGVKGSKWLNTVSILDTTRWIWTTPKIAGSAPKPRSYHSATAVKKHNGFAIVVFGGNNKSSCFDTVHILENKENEWKWSHPTITGKAPFPRTGHSATLLDDGKTISIYGGWDPNEEDSTTGGENIFKSSFLLDTETWEWKSGAKAVPGGSGSDATCAEDCGPKRCGHTSVLNPESGEVWLFGGRIPGEALAGDFQRLSSEEKLVGLDGK